MATASINGKKTKHVLKEIASRWSDKQVDGFLGSWCVRIDQDTQQLVIVTAEGITLARRDGDVSIPWPNVVFYGAGGRLEYLDGQLSILTFFHPKEAERFSELIGDHAPGRTRRTPLDVHGGAQLMRLPDDVLGQETVRMLELAEDRKLAQYAPTSEGWYTDPLGSDTARYFTGTKWSGRQRRIVADISGKASRVSHDELDTLSRGRATLATTSSNVTPILVVRGETAFGFDGVHWCTFENDTWTQLRGSAYTPEDLPSAEQLRIAELPATFAPHGNQILEVYRAAVAAGYVGQYGLGMQTMLEGIEPIHSRESAWNQGKFGWWEQPNTKWLEESGAMWRDTECYGTIRTIAKVITTNGKAAEWRRFDEGANVVVLATAIVFETEQYNLDGNVTVSLTVDGELITSHRPTLTRLAVLSVLPGSALAPGLALAKEKRVDERTAILSITHPDWQLVVQVMVDALPKVRPIIHRLETRLTQIERDQASQAPIENAPVTSPAPVGRSAVEELSKLAALVESGFLSAEEAADLKAAILQPPSTG